LQKKHMGTAALGCPAGQCPAGCSPTTGSDLQPTQNLRSCAPRTAEGGCPYIRTEKSGQRWNQPLAKEHSLCTFVYIYRPRWLFSFGALCFFGGGLDLCEACFDELPLDFGGVDSLVLFC
jgi:hypothetical protein